MFCRYLPSSKTKDSSRAYNIDGASHKYIQTMIFYISFSYY